MKNLSEAQAVLREGCFFDFPTPWIGDTAKRIHADGAYADYAGWKDWLSREYPEVADAVDDMNEPSNSIFYAVMSDACRVTAETMGWKPSASSKE